MNLPSLVDLYGIARFRAIESEVLKGISTDHHTVFALGGGTLDEAQSREWLSGRSSIVYLRIDPSDLSNRGTRSPPKTFGQRDFFEVCQERLPIYEKVCHYVIDVNKKTVEDLVTELIELRPWH